MIDNSKYILFTLLAYKLILILIGLWSRKKNNSVSDYFIASRRLGPWIAALSASASSSSAWTLLGVSGAAYLWGLPALWIFPATLSGFFINWLFIAPKLNQLSQKHQLLTLTEFLALGKNGTVKEIKYLASFIIVFCFIFYIASQFDAAGQSFESTFGLKKSESILIGIAIILFYTLLGGFWAVSVSDSLQGIMMAISAIILPIVALSQAGLDQIFMDLSSQSLFSTPSGITGLAAFGFIIGSVCRGVVCGIVTTLGVMIFVPLHVHSYIALLFFTLMGCTMMGTLGTIVGIWADKWDQQQGITNFIVLPLTFLSGTCLLYTSPSPRD
mgnify:CR=1 FL=1